MEFLVGVFSGLAGGLGVGGGSILLLYLTAFAGEAAEIAKGANLFFFLPTAVIAVAGHIKNGFIKWKTALLSAVFGIPFVFLGFFIAQSIDKTLLKLVFALFLLIVGIKAYFSGQ